jgi:hypothetical protein
LVNEEKNRTVNLDRAESFGFLVRLPSTPQRTEAGVAGALYAKAEEAQGVIA